MRGASDANVPCIPERSKGGRAGWRGQGQAGCNGGRVSRAPWPSWHCLGLLASWMAIGRRRKLPARGRNCHATSVAVIVVLLALGVLPLGLSASSYSCLHPSLWKKGVIALAMSHATVLGAAWHRVAHTLLRVLVLLMFCLQAAAPPLCVIGERDGQGPGQPKLMHYVEHTSTAPQPKTHALCSYSRCLQAGCLF